MQHPKHIRIEAYQYDLPDSHIAKEPLKERDTAKLLVFNNQQINHSQYKDLAQHLPQNSLVCFNETKVINARLYFKKSTGGKIEIFCLEPSNKYADVTTAMSSRHRVYWNCLVGGASKWKNQEPITCITNTEQLQLTAQIHQKKVDSYEILFEWNTNDSFAEALSTLGEIPLPPYLNRKAVASDYETYQTMFAKQEGSVAAPTASLHFTPSLIKSIQDHHHHTTQLTLHVGAGTFKPVKSETMDTHEMHPEFIEVSLQTLTDLHEQLTQKHPIIAVGTTSVRTLESLYWIGNLLAQGQDIQLQDIVVTQWMPYESTSTTSAINALQLLITYLQQHELTQLVTRTQIIIAPGYHFKIIDGIITNFHQPQSTLLLLISAFLGDEWKNIYHQALNNNYRFLSYGDGCLLLK